MASKSFFPRVHLDFTTRDFMIYASEDILKVQEAAELIVRTGAWVDNRLYPPGRIVFVELVAV